MAITAQFLSQCTDEQINKGVAWLRFCGVVEADDDWKDYIDLSDIPKNPTWPSYCTNPNDIMPIAFANGIGIGIKNNSYGERYRAFAEEDAAQGRSSTHRFNKWNTNPLRAICEVYILMSVSK